MTPPDRVEQEREEVERQDTGPWTILEQLSDHARAGSLAELRPEWVAEQLSHAAARARRERADLVQHLSLIDAIRRALDGVPNGEGFTLDAHVRGDLLLVDGVRCRAARAPKYQWEGLTWTLVGPIRVRLLDSDKEGQGE